MSIELEMQVLERSLRLRGLCDQLRDLYVRIAAEAPERLADLDRIIDGERRLHISQHDESIDRLLIQTLEVMALLPKAEKQAWPRAEPCAKKTGYECSECRCTFYTPEAYRKHLDGHGAGVEEME